MHDTLTCPGIAVTIGRQRRRYHAFVTTAPPALDGPATMTLYASSQADVAGFAADPDAFRATKPSDPARLVLVEATELGWQRARYRTHQHVLAPADAVLVGPSTLQHWLWQRLQAPLRAMGEE
jgi:hypothetical protein